MSKKIIAAMIALTILFVCVFAACNKDKNKDRAYIEKDEYNTFLEKISRTGNLYDISIEVHKPILIPIIEDGETVYQEDTIIDNMIDIEKSINDYDYYKLDNVFNILFKLVSIIITIIIIIRICSIRIITSNYK